MKPYPGSEKIDDADSLIAEREKSRLDDIILFTDAYASSRPRTRQVLKRLSDLPDNWFSQTNRLSRPYIQFQVTEIERSLGKAINPAEDEPRFSNDILDHLEHSLSALDGIFAQVDTVSGEFLEWHFPTENLNKVRLDASSEMARHLIGESFGRSQCMVLDSAQIEAWRKTFTSAQHILKMALPELMPNLQASVAAIVPVRPAGPNLSLSSTPESVNGVFLASQVNAKYLAETIVHEVGHDILNRINLVEPMFHEGVCSYYSPFRADTRPASGLLHAAYSFYNVIQMLVGLRESEPRLTAWADGQLDSYWFNTALCARILIYSSELPPAGSDLVNLLSHGLESFKGSYEFSLSNDMIEEKRRHFEAWAENEKKSTVKISKEAFEDLVTSVPVNATRKRVAVSRFYPSYEPLDCLRSRFRRISSPVVVRQESLVDTDVLRAELVRLGREEVSVLAVAEHKGFSDTPRKTISLGEHVEDFKAKEGSADYFLVIKGIETKVSDKIWREDPFFQDFWIDEGHSWLFWNKEGIIVPLHNDSVNNLHCIVSGTKTFFLSPPEEEFRIKSPGQEYNAGFSSFKPFENIDAANRLGSFVTVTAGDMLYIPDGWWHSVRYETDCLAISAFDEDVS